MELNRTIHFNWLANMPNMLNDLVCQDRPYKIPPLTVGTDTVTSLLHFTRFIMCDCDVEELTK